MFEGKFPTDNVRSEAGLVQVLAGSFDDTDKHQGVYRQFAKRALDFTMAIIALPVVAPLMVCIAICICATGGSPIYAHRRVGMDRRAFYCYKFQTMRKDSPRLLRLMLRTDRRAAREWSHSQKLRFDPRVTRLGRFLRATSLDELPQLFNVLRGDMSLVGPRPVTESELKHYAHRLPIYLSLRPGLTGPWQVFGRGNTSYEERVDMDCRYEKDCRFLYDLAIMFRTVGVVFRKTGT